MSRVKTNQQEAFSADLNTEKRDNAISWRYLIHDVLIIVFEFFFGPRIKKATDLNLLEQAKILLESRTENTDKSTIDICKELIQAHRVHENTKSRKRLEIWATVVISIYLVLICFLFILNSLTIDGEKVLSCDSNLMIALLTTTTINILGLVVIVLKGYFPPKSNKDSEKE